MGLYDGAKKTLKGIVEKEAEVEQQQEDVDLTPHEHKRALKSAYKSFVIPGAEYNLEFQGSIRNLQKRTPRNALK